MSAMKTESHRVKVVRQETLRSYINRAATYFENLVRTTLIFILPFCTQYTSLCFDSLKVCELH
eukprot:scaffold15609_cov46-Cyclotella_meneghiniana.AAC.1